MVLVKIQWQVEEDAMEWLKEDARIKKLSGRGRYGIYMEQMIEELKSLRKKCGDFETDNDGHPVK
jgi:hypothetical protein